MNDSSIKPTFRPVREQFAANGLGNTVGYEIIRAGLIKVFKIGSRTYAECSEFDNLPARLATPEAQAQLRAARYRAKKAAAR